MARRRGFLAVRMVQVHAHKHTRNHKQLHTTTQTTHNYTQPPHHIPIAITVTPPINNSPQSHPTNHHPITTPINPSRPVTHLHVVARVERLQVELGARLGGPQAQVDAVARRKAGHGVVVRDGGDLGVDGVEMMWC